MFCPAVAMECSFPHNRIECSQIDSNSPLSSRSDGLRRQRSGFKQRNHSKDSTKFMRPPHGGLQDWQSSPSQCVSWMQREVLSHLARLDRKLDDIAFRLDMGGANWCEQKELREAKLDTRSPQPPQLSSRQCQIAAAFDDQRRPSKKRNQSKDHPWCSEGGSIVDPQICTTLLSKPSPNLLSKRMPSGDTMVDLVHSPTLEAIGEKDTLEYELTAESDTFRAGSKVRRQLTDSTRETDSCPNADGKDRPASPSSEEKPWSAEHSEEKPWSSMDSRESVISKKLKDKSEVGQCRENLWNMFEDPESGGAAKAYSIFTSCFILLSVCFTLMQSLPSPPIKGITGAIGESIVEACFLIELLMRFACCPYRRTFLTCTYNLIDLCAVVPLVLRCICGFSVQDADEDGLRGWAQKVLLCVVPVLRLLKIVRRFERFQLLQEAFVMIFEALPVCLFPLALMTLLFSAAIFLVEPRDNIPTLWHAMWLTIVTMTTVGYGDITPSQAAGSIVVSVLVMSSVLYMAMPLGIIGQAFTEVWSNRDRILLMKRAKVSLSQWGYKPSEIPHLFDMFDKDGSGELELPEFQEMMAAMRIGLSQERVVQIFSSIDIDCGGSVDSSEFLRFLFPGGYLDLCSEEHAGKEKPELQER